MNEKEDKEFSEKFIISNPFDFKQGIIHHCRQMDKIDVYEWVAEDELKIQRLQKRIDKAIEYINDLSLDFYDYECNQLIVGKYIINDLLEILKVESNE